MIIILLILLIISCIGLMRTNNQEDCLKKEYTDSIKGIFIIIVFYSHIIPILTSAGVAFSPILDYPSNRLIHRIGQLMVVMFLFYSGYGVMESIRNKGDVYVKAIPIKRVLSTLANYAIAVTVFLVMNKLLGINYSFKQYILSLVAWESIGQSNWYIFAILFCYISTYISFSVFRKVRSAFYANCLLILLYIVVLYQFKEEWWYNTIPAYAAGMFVSINRDKILSLLNRLYPVCLIVLILAFILCFHFRSMTIIYLVLSIVFALLMLTITYRYVIKSHVLGWCGKNLFQLYIYQRLPMVALSTLFPQIVRLHTYLYVFACLAITLLIAATVKPFSIKANKK